MPFSTIRFGAPGPVPWGQSRLPPLCGRCFLWRDFEMQKSAPHVAAIHDLSGMGRCSLGIVLPVLSALGCWCSPLPTAYLSSSTIFPPSDKFVFRDLTGEMAGSTEHWKELDTRFDAVYSGFVGSAEQIGVLGRFIQTFRGPETLVMVDPVMGDWGKRYRTYTERMCEEMCELAALADVITPNLTEAAILLGEDYAAAPRDEAGLRRWLERLSLEGHRSVILTGVHPGPGLVGAGCFDRETGEVAFAAAHEEPAQFPGTGDLFASVALGSLLAGKPLGKATSLAVEFVGRCARRTLELGTPIPEGVQYEGLLGELVRS